MVLQVASCLPEMPFGMRVVSKPLLEPALAHIYVYMSHACFKTRGNSRPLAFLVLVWHLTEKTPVRRPRRRLLRIARHSEVGVSCVIPMARCTRCRWLYPSF